MGPPHSCALSLSLWLSVSQLWSRDGSQPPHHGRSGLDNSVCVGKGGRGGERVSTGIPGLATLVAAGGPPPSAVTSSSVHRHRRCHQAHITFGWRPHPKETFLLVGWSIPRIPASLSEPRSDLQRGSPALAHGFRDVSRCEFFRNSTVSRCFLGISHSLLVA